MRTPFLENETTALIPLEPDDAAICYKWFLDFNVRKFLSSHNVPNTLEKSKRFIEQMNASHTDVLLGIVYKPESKYIGNIALHGIDFYNRNGYVGIAIGEQEYRCKGIGRQANSLLLNYAFNTLNLNMVFLNVFADNERAIRSYEKVGFKKAGVIPQCFFREGKYIDCVIMAILRSEFTYLT